MAAVGDESNRIGPFNPDVTADLTGVGTEATATAGAAVAPPRPRSLPSASPSIGPYHLLRKIGEGGMGQVWLAQQNSPLQRQVALKLVRFGGGDRATIQRFESERQTLARMEHPAIAKVFDAGTTPQGEPYFVMEYVPGLPITTYCDQKRMTLKDRLALFVSVCEGVQHAHQKAIIHRDLKPSNILVTEVDGKPLPRIIDFGIAKATTSSSDAGPAFTQAGVFVGTPGYMSPEQADPNTQDVDTRTDVYSLGVVLYELLAGNTPFDSASWRGRPLHEVLRQLQEDDPPTPSTRLEEDKTSLTSIAEKRGAPSRHLTKALARRSGLDRA